MASKFKKGSIWYIRAKVSGTWKNISCGPSATAREAETIRQKYDAQEFNRRHDILIRPVHADLDESGLFFIDDAVGTDRGSDRPAAFEAVI